VVINNNGIDNAGAGDQQEVGVLQSVNDAFLSIPGIPSLAEFAAGTNRSIAGFLDFLGPDNVNAVLELSGSDKRIPTLTETITSPGGFVEPGLQQKILSTAGEIAPAALAIGQTLRTLASKLPGFAATESAPAGLLRQTGAVTASQDIAGGIAAGAGQEVGREVAGEEGALAGAVIAPVSLAAIPLNAARGAASKLLSKAAPSVEQLKDAARGIYQSLDESGVTVSKNSFNSLADDIASTLRKEGSDIDLTPKATAIVKRLQSEKGTAKTLTELDTLRKVARGAAESIDKSESRLGVIAVNKIDEFLDGIGTEITQGKEAGQAFRSARDLWQRARKSETLEQALKNAEDQASGFENGIRTQFRQILKRINTGKQKGFTKEETDAIRKIVQGTKAGNIAKFLGKFGILDGVTSRSLTTLGGVGLAGAAGGTGAAAAVPLIGQVSGALAQRMTLNNAKMAQSIIRAGKNGNLITNIYLRNTPQSARNPAELAELFIKNKVPLENINLRKARPLISDAAVIASIAKLNDQKEESQ
jgi:CheY-specific phosphatase CheX